MSDDSDYHNWDIFVPGMYHLSLESYIWKVGHGKYYYGVNKDNIESPPDVALSIIDLLENAATLFEFQISTKRQQLIDPLIFSRWCKRNPCNIEIWKFVSKNLGKELALRCFLPLVNASFKTSRPIQTFITLLAKLQGFLAYDECSSTFISQQEPCRWPTLFESFLKQIHFDCGPDFDGHSDPLGLFSQAGPLPYCILTLRKWVYATFTDGNTHMVHPFLSQPAKNWLKDEVENPRLGWLMDQPGWVEKDDLEYCIDNCNPPLTFTRFHIDGINDRVVSFGDLTQCDIAGMPIVSLMTVFSVIMKASSVGLDEDRRLCHHKQCPEYSSNYCHIYPVIPINYSDCHFPYKINEIVTDWKKAWKRKSSPTCCATLENHNHTSIGRVKKEDNLWNILKSWVNRMFSMLLKKRYKS